MRSGIGNKIGCSDIEWVSHCPTSCGFESGCPVIKERGWCARCAGAESCGGGGLNHVGGRVTRTGMRFELRRELICPPPHPRGDDEVTYYLLTLGPTLTALDMDWCFEYSDNMSVSAFPSPTTALIHLGTVFTDTAPIAREYAKAQAPIMAGSAKLDLGS